MHIIHFMNLKYLYMYAHTIYHISVLYHKPQKFEDYNEKSKTIVYSELSKESVFFKT